MTTITSATTMIEAPFESAFDEAQLAAASLLARASGRTLEAYRHDRRGFFQWATDNVVDVLAATRGHIELFRSWMEQRALAASTIDRRLSTVCGFYRFAQSVRAHRWPHRVELPGDTGVERGHHERCSQHVGMDVAESGAARRPDRRPRRRSTRSMTVAARTSIGTLLTSSRSSLTVDARRTLEHVSDAARHSDGTAQGTSLWPADLTADQLASAPVIASLDTLLIDDLIDHGDDAFAAALDA